MEGAGEKAFCAGGDVAQIQAEVISVLKDGGDETSFSVESRAVNFFYEEYQLNYLIATAFERANITQISLWNGITMGGGVGLSLHGKYRVATERTLFAMPETGIGLFPDVGGTFALSRLRLGGSMEPTRSIGVYLALTGTRLRAADCLFAGLATHFVSTAKLVELKKELSKISSNDAQKPAMVESIISSFSTPYEAIPDKDKTIVIEPFVAEIEKCFKFGTVEEIIAALTKENNEWAKKTLETLRKMSPLSLKVTLEAIIRASDPATTIGDALRIEYRLSQRFMRLQPHSDFTEGIRAVLVDKDNKPKWNPSTIEAVSEDVVNEFFKPLNKKHPRGELELD
jgi:enoyl-CoA hydratase/carnithine racemase